MGAVHSRIPGTPRDSATPLASPLAALHLTEGPEGVGYRPAVRDTRFRGHPVPPQAQARQGSGRGLDYLIDTLRRRLQASSSFSLEELQGLYLQLGPAPDGSLSRSEFNKGLLRLGLLASEEEGDNIFSYFDEDRSGRIDLGEFVCVLKGGLPQSRRKVVQEAFGFLDVDRDGVVDKDDLSMAFQAFQHPDVISGAKTQAEALEEFLELFDTITGDRQISLPEFEKYYESCSALLVSDAHFMTMVRNTWRLPGATGNSCMRVSIVRGEQAGRAPPQRWRTDRDPKRWGLPNGQMTQQEIVEIRPPLRISQHDPRFGKAILKRLEEMGYHDVAKWEMLSTNS